MIIFYAIVITLTSVILLVSIYDGVKWVGLVISAGLLAGLYMLRQFAQARKKRGMVPGSLVEQEDRENGLFPSYADARRLVLFLGTIFIALGISYFIAQSAPSPSGRVSGQIILYVYNILGPYGVGLLWIALGVAILAKAMQKRNK